MQLDTQEVINK